MFQACFRKMAAIAVVAAIVEAFRSAPRPPVPQKDEGLGQNSCGTILRIT
jgi:hypothetical protein